MWQYRQVKRTTLIALGCAAFLGGLALVAIGVNLYGLAWPLTALVLLVTCIKRRAYLAVPAVLVTGIIFGIWRGSLVANDIALYQQFIGQNVTMVGEVIDDQTYDDRGQSNMYLKNILINGRQLPGKVRVKGFTVVPPDRGNILEVKGILREGFGSYQAAMYYGSITIVATHQSPTEQLRRHFAASVFTNIPDPQASLGLGFLLGLKSQLPQDLDAQLKTLGLTHIVVASGYNLTVLLRLAKRALQKYSKFQTVALGGGLALAFVCVTGLSSSMSRAALVTGLVLWAWYYGRAIHPVILLLMTAAITTVIHPLYLWSDLGWWLSFLAFAGVMLLAPLLQHWIFGDREPKLIGQVVIETIAAQLLTLPLILWIFGDFSVLSILANVLVVPLIPIIMALTFVTGLAGLVVTSVAPYLAQPATWFLTYLTELVELLSRIHWASLKVHIPMWGMIVCYSTLLIFGLVLWCTTRHDFLRRSVID